MMRKLNFTIQNTLGGNAYSRPKLTKEPHADLYSVRQEGYPSGPRRAISPHIADLYDPGENAANLRPAQCHNDRRAGNATLHLPPLSNTNPSGWGKTVEMLYEDCTPKVNA